MNPYQFVAKLALILFISCVQAAELEITDLNMKHAGQPTAELVTGGQPSLDDLEKLKQRGGKRIINLRSPGEFDQFNEAEVADRLGFHYQNIPVAGAADITWENAEKLENILAESNELTLIHCASSNRVGALLALREFRFHQANIESAIVAGQKAGLGSLKSKVEEMLKAASQPQ